jgi:hypothetical protein
MDTSLYESFCAYQVRYDCLLGTKEWKQRQMTKDKRPPLRRKGLIQWLSRCCPESIIHALTNHEVEMIN